MKFNIAVVGIILLNIAGKILLKSTSVSLIMFKWFNNDKSI